MQPSALARPESAKSRDNASVERIGLAKLAKLAFDGGDLRPLWNAIWARVAAGQATAAEALDLSLIAQLLGDKELGLSIQSQALAQQQLFKLPCAAAEPRLRVLALATPMDFGGNTPIEFLLEGSDIELMTLYLMPGVAPPAPLPDHDVGIVIASECDESREALSEIGRLAMRWPRPLLNAPGQIANLGRDTLHRVLSGISGLTIPATARVTRSVLAQLAQSAPLEALAAGLAFPITLRPTGSHAGFGLAKIDDRAAVARYLAERPEQEFFVSSFVDYASPDGQFRKYRIAVVDGRPFACHMAILGQWNIWYLNAAMSASAAKRSEEERFMVDFDEGFGARHRRALAEMTTRLALDYFTIDCAEDREGRLLIFEADNTGVVHNMDSAELFPYKPPQMRKIFTAFAAMLTQRAGLTLADA